jgi:lipopolysaccharide export system protein LptC
MVNPTLKGVDKKNGAYVVSADYADQDMKNPKLIKLHAIKAELTTDQKGWSRMQAVRGLFNSESERLVMQDDIRVSTSSGVTGRLTHASLEMRRQTLRSHQPVAFDLPSGTVRANALTLNSADKTLLFRGKVRVRIVRVDNKQTAAGQAPRPPQIKAPEAPARIPPEAPVPVATEAAPQ